jgi:hypothetical protein
MDPPEIQQEFEDPPKHNGPNKYTIIFKGPPHLQIIFKRPTEYTISSPKKFGFRLGPDSTILLVTVIPRHFPKSELLSIFKEDEGQFFKKNPLGACMPHANACLFILKIKWPSSSYKKKLTKLGFRVIPSRHLLTHLI